MPTHNLRERINWLERDEVTDLLESVGIACFDSEATDELRESLAANIEDGTIPDVA